MNDSRPRRWRGIVAAISALLLCAYNDLALFGPIGFPRRPTALERAEATFFHPYLWGHIVFAVVFLALAAVRSSRMRQAGLAYLAFLLIGIAAEIYLLHFSHLDNGQGG